MSIVIVTGASAGIGLAAAKKFLSEGFKVFNLSRRPCPDSRVRSFSIDLSSPDLDEVVEGLLCKEFEESKGANIHLVHNAARLENDSSINTYNETLEKVMRVNVLAQNTLNRFFLPLMGKDSSVIFVGSTLSEKAVPGSFSYVTSKHAQIGMMRSLCQDLVGTGIHTATICPGFTDTEMLREHVADDALSSIAELNAFQRLIEPAEIAQTIYWASQNPVINGSVIHANLGQIER
ncbi:MAG: SDR family NAD(P)-dependent oxidoreductase [Gammaproteobacteria bacterium]|nr:SDR family NAD(P)-dependent oxidoreductase [Gammaproteobacteria bacterium]